MAAGLRWLELDVRRCADGALVAGHFPAHADGAFTATLTLAEARARGAVPLEELLDGLPPHIAVDLDLKTSLEDALRPAGRRRPRCWRPVAARMAQERVAVRLLVRPVGAADPARAGARAGARAC